MKPREFIRKAIGIIMVNSSNGNGMTDDILEYLRKWVLEKKKKGITWKGSFDKCSRSDRYKIRINEALEDLAKELK